MTRAERVAKIRLYELLKLRHNALLQAKASRHIGKSVEKFQAIELEISDIRSQFPNIQVAIAMSEKERSVKVQTELDGLEAIAKYLVKNQAVNPI